MVRNRTMGDRRRQAAKPGFTLVELLVVIAIIGILIALLLPAVQAAREAARRSQCTNNLKQISLALHNYHDTYKTFPPGWVVPSAGNTALDTPDWGWTAFLLPFIEQKPLYDQLQVNLFRLEYWSSTNWNTGNPTGQQLLQTGIETCVCPSSKSREINPNKNVSGHDVGTSNYPGVKGLRNGQGTNNNLNMNTVQECWGILSANSETTFADITDGTSNTFAVGERRQEDNAANWPGVNDTATGNGGNVTGAVCFKLNGTSNAGVAFNSEHPGGANFALCDASVRFISETIEFSNGGKTSNYGANWSGCTNCWVETATDPPGFPANLGVYQLLGMFEDGIPVSEF